MLRDGTRMDPVPTPSPVTVHAVYVWVLYNHYIFYATDISSFLFVE